MSVGISDGKSGRFASRGAASTARMPTPINAAITA